MTPRFGIDTSILVRLVTGDPEESYERCVRSLTALIEGQGAEIFASNQDRGKLYRSPAPLQRDQSGGAFGSGQRLSSGLVGPSNGHGVLEILSAISGCGLLDRLIADDYRRAGLVSLTCDRKMSVLPDARLL